MAPTPKSDPEEGTPAKTDAKTDAVEMVPYTQLFRYADRKAKLYTIIGLLGAAAHGSAFPVFLIIFGSLIDEFADTNADVVSGVSDLALQVTYIAIAVFFCSYVQVSCLTLAAQQQSARIRQLYFTSLMRQEIGWYDLQSSGTLSTRISGSIPKIEEAIGEKLGSYTQFMFMFLSGMGVGFGYGWKLTLVILSVCPVLALSGGIMSKFLAEATGMNQKFYGIAGAVCDEVFQLIRTVLAFGTQEKEVLRYKRELMRAEKAGIHAAKIQGIGMGFVFFCIFSTYALSFWYGAKLKRDDEITSGDVITVFFAVVTGAMAIGQAAPSLAAFAAGRGSAVGIFQTIDRVSLIDSLSTEGAKPDSVSGHIEFRDVSFRYPSRPNEPLYDKLSIDFPAGTTVALVGPSGCGKSTAVNLIERFYDPLSGSVLLDGRDLRDLNVQWLRQKIALVSQQPVLFPTTIYENIAAGKVDATPQEVEQAARMANAHDFVMSFPEAYQTQVGDQGVQLSGGQKQRIAVARALINDPKILLLDEATSALDTESEMLVQEALEKASKTRTTIVIAHRLSTIFSADYIIVMKDGKIVEQGTHQQLLEAHGTYFEMVQSQHQGDVFKLQENMTAAAAAGTKNRRESELHISNKDAKAKNGKGMNLGEENSDADSSDGEDNDDAAADTDKKKKDAQMSNGHSTAVVRKRAPKAPAVATSTLIWWVFGQQGKDVVFMLLASVCAIVEGLVWPAFAIIFTEMLKVLINDNTTSGVRKWALAFVGLAVLVAFAVGFKFYFSSIVGERLTTRMRENVFRSMLSKPLAWFDERRNAKAVLTTRLAEDAALVRGLVTDRIPLTVQILASLLGGIILALVYCWEVALVVIACIPVIAVGGAMQMRLMTGFAKGKESDKSNRLANEAIDSIRTVLSLGRVGQVSEDYKAACQQPLKTLGKGAVVCGVAYGFAEFCMFGIWALAFWFGARMVDLDRCDFGGMMTALSAIIFGAMVSGQISSMLPDAKKATTCARRMYRYVHEVSSVRAPGLPPIVFGHQKPPVAGHVELRDVHFTYPSRPDAPVLRGLNLTLPVGRTTALVGKSGCGKSTIVALLERFYAPDSGSIIMDGVDLNQWDEVHLRQHLAYVNQEPKLFSTTIEENVLYGMADSDPVRDAELVRAAARDANADEFVSELKDGYKTRVGDKGIMLSGGQRQRVAIARALVRPNIKMLLLDEASSALDTRNEVLVHRALDKARMGRTTVIIAHRLSTIRSADNIAVVEDGRIIEQGSHDELMAKRGAYAMLVASKELDDFDPSKANSADLSPSMPRKEQPAADGSYQLSTTGAMVSAV